MCGCLPCGPHWGSSPQPSCVPWLGIQAATLWSQPHSIHWATPARAISFLFKTLQAHSSILSNFFSFFMLYVSENADVLEATSWRFEIAPWTLDCQDTTRSRCSLCGQSSSRSFSAATPVCNIYTLETPQVQVLSFFLMPCHTLYYLSLSWILIPSICLQGPKFLSQPKCLW